jgi:magnesium transporter
MQGDRSKILIDSIKRLLRRDATPHLRKIVNKTHAADLSVVFRSLSVYNQRKLFEMIEDMEQKGVLFSELDEDTFMALIEGIDVDNIVGVLEHMPTDDVADLIGRLPDDMSDAFLERMKKKDSEEVEGLLRYGDDTAGGIMLRCLFIFMLLMNMANW